MQGERGIEPASYSSFSFRKEWKWLLLLGLLIFLGNFPLLFGRTYQDLQAFIGDFYVAVDYAFRIIGECFHNGYFPLWDPSMSSGKGGLALPVAGLSYPLSMFCSSLGFLRGIVIFYFLHFELMGIFSYLAFRRLGVDPASSLLISGWNALSGYTVYVSAIPGVIAPLPWFFLVIYLLARTEGLPWRVFLALISAFMMMVLSGEVEGVVYCGYFGGIFLILYWYFSGQKNFSRILIVIFLSLIIAGVFSSYYFFPSLNYLSRTVRLGKPSYQAYLESQEFFQFMKIGFFGLFSRKFIGLYYSFLAVGFALIGAVRRRENPSFRASFYLLLILLALLVFPEIGLGKIVYHIPIYSRFIRHYKLGFLFQFIFLLWAGFGLDWFFSALQNQEKRKKALALALVLVFLSWAFSGFNYLLLGLILLVIFLYLFPKLSFKTFLIAGLILALDCFPYLWHPPYPFFHLDYPKLLPQYLEKARESLGKYRLQVFYPCLSISFWERDEELPIHICGYPWGGEGFDSWLSFPLKDYAEFLSLIIPDLKNLTKTRGMIFNYNLPFKCLDYITSENRHLLNMVGLRWLFLKRFSLRESDLRQIIYDPDYFLNPKRKKPFGRYKVKVIEEKGKTVPVLASRFSARFRYEKIDLGDYLSFRISSPKAPSWFMIFGSNKKLLFARKVKGKSPQFIIPLKSSRFLDFVLLNPSGKFSGWLDPEISNPQKTIKYRGGDEIKIYENPEALPRAWLVHQARYFPNKAELKNFMKDHKKFIPSQMVLLFGQKSSEEIFPSQTKAEKIQIKSYKRERIELEAELNSPGWLVWASTYFPGWKAKVNGREEQVLKANLAFQGLKLNPGENQVILFFQPMDFAVGLWVSLGSLFFWLGLVGLRWFQRILSSS